MVGGGASPRKMMPIRFTPSVLAAASGRRVNPAASTSSFSTCTTMTSRGSYLFARVAMVATVPISGHFAQEVDMWSDIGPLWCHDSEPKSAQRP